MSLIVGSPPILISPDLNRRLLYVNSRNHQPCRVQNGNISSRKSSVSFVMKIRHCIRSRFTWRPCTTLTSRKFRAQDRIGSLFVRLTQEIVNNSTRGNSRNGVSAKNKYERATKSSSGGAWRKGNVMMKEKARFTLKGSRFRLKRLGKQSIGRPLYQRWTWSLAVTWKPRHICPVSR